MTLRGNKDIKISYNSIRITESEFLIERSDLIVIDIKDDIFS